MVHPSPSASPCQSALSPGQSVLLPPHHSISKLLIGHLREDSCKSGAYLCGNNSGAVTARYTRVLLLIISPLLFNDTDLATPPVALLMHEDFAPAGIMTLSVNEVYAQVRVMREWWDRSVSRTEGLDWQ